MYYSLVGILALLNLLITNYDVLRPGKASPGTPVQKSYRALLLAIAAYYVTDIAWGALEALSLTRLLFADTEVYFVAMALGVLCWTRYVLDYLGEQTLWRRAFSNAGAVFFVSVAAAEVCNLFSPVLFWIDEAGVYHPGPVRYLVLGTQILLLFLTSVYALRVSARTQGEQRRRHRTIGLSGVTMLVFVSIQIFFPYLPLYSIAYMMGSSLLHTFVVEDEKEEYRRNLELALEKEQRQIRELNEARQMANTDALTGVLSKGAYSRCVDNLQERLEAGDIAFGIGVFDCDDLKKINDRYGHDKGDVYLKNACQVICQVFTHSPVFRVGGDEFSVVLRGQDLFNWEELVERFEREQEEFSASAEEEWESVRVAVGVAVYDPDNDPSVVDTVRRADKLMYENKHRRKEGRQVHP